MTDWFTTFFDRGYLARYSRVTTEEATQREVEGVVDLLGLAPGDRILDLACGYGRHAVPLAARGFEVVGYDLSGDLLAEAQLRAASAGVDLTLVEGDMRRLSFVREFDAAISLFTSFGFFEDERDNRRVVEGVHAALREDGRFLLDVINRDAVVRHFQPTMWVEADDGHVLSENQFDPFRSRITGRQIHLLLDGRSAEYPLSLRVYSAHEMVRLLGEGGFALEALYGDFDRSFFDVDSRRIVSVARRA